MAFRGTLAPFFLASESPIAIACLRLFTLPPFPPGPDLRVPRFLRRIADSTVLPAALPYFRLLDDFFFAAIRKIPSRNVMCGSSRKGPGVRQAIIEVIETGISANNQSLRDTDTRLWH